MKNLRKPETDYIVSLKNIRQLYPKLINVNSAFRKIKVHFLHKSNRTFGEKTSYPFESIFQYVIKKQRQSDYATAANTVISLQKQEMKQLKSRKSKTYLNDEIINRPTLTPLPSRGGCCHAVSHLFLLRTFE